MPVNTHRTFETPQKKQVKVGFTPIPFGPTRLWRFKTPWSYLLAIAIGAISNQIWHQYIPGLVIDFEGMAILWIGVTGSTAVAAYQSFDNAGTEWVPRGGFTFSHRLCLLLWVVAGGFMLAVPYTVARLVYQAVASRLNPESSSESNDRGKMQRPASSERLVRVGYFTIVGWFLFVWQGFGVWQTSLNASVIEVASKVGWSSHDIYTMFGLLPFSSQNPVYRAVTAVMFAAVSVFFLTGGAIFPSFVNRKLAGRSLPVMTLLFVTVLNLPKLLGILTILIFVIVWLLFVAAGLAALWFIFRLVFFDEGSRAPTTPIVRGANSHFNSDGSPKKAYRSEKEANDEAQRLHRKDGASMSYYVCAECSHYHVGHSR